MQFFYDGQIRRYVTQFMRIFIGFKVKAGDGTLKQIPVMYGDLTRQVASIIRENSENKIPSVPRIACYITGIELDRTRLSDSSFVSKVNVRERAYTTSNGVVQYENYQGGGYTVERLMPTPYKLTVRADIWASNTDQKLQILEQILMLFNPSIEVQTTDNYIDWTSLTVVELTGTTFSSRTIPAGTENDIDVSTLDFEMPIYISAPTKVKKLGVVKNIIMNMFTEQGNVSDLSDILFNDPSSQQTSTPGNFGILILRNNNGNPHDYNVEVLDAHEAVDEMNFEYPIRKGAKIDWNIVLTQYEGYQPGISQMFLLQPDGYEIGGTFTVNPIDSTNLVLTLDEDTIPSNTLPSVTAVVDPYKFNPLTIFGNYAGIPVGTRYLMLDDVFPAKENEWTAETRKVTTPTINFNTAVLFSALSSYELYVNGVYTESTVVDNGGNCQFVLPSAVNNAKVTIKTIINKEGPDAWKNSDMTNTSIPMNSIIEWTGNKWELSFIASAESNFEYVTNLKTGIQYKWDREQWVKSFEGVYSSGYWRFVLDPI